MRIKAIAVSFLLAISAMILSSCENPSRSSHETDEVQKMTEKINEAFDNRDFKKHQMLCDDMYSKIKDTNHCMAKVWLSSEYFFLCCYNGGNEDVDDVTMKMELYTEKYLGIGILWESVKDMDAIWFSNIERCAKLILQAYEDNPSRTEKFVNEHEFEPYQIFARIVLRKR